MCVKLFISLDQVRGKDLGSGCKNINYCIFRSLGYYFSSPELYTIKSKGKKRKK